MITVRIYEERDVPEMTRIWNEVVEEGNAFPQDAPLTAETALAFFAQQTRSAVAEDGNGRICGLYILHPNLGGRLSTACNASYAVEKASRGLHIGEALVKDCLAAGKACGYSVLQFNAVVASNIHARHLYERLGFTMIGTVPGVYRLKDGSLDDICLYYHRL